MSDVAVEVSVLRLLPVTVRAAVHGPEMTKLLLLGNNVKCWSSVRGSRKKDFLWHFSLTSVEDTMRSRKAVKNNV